MRTDYFQYNTMHYSFPVCIDTTSSRWKLKLNLREKGIKILVFNFNLISITSELPIRICIVGRIYPLLIKKYRFDCPFNNTLSKDNFVKGAVSRKRLGNHGCMHCNFILISFLMVSLLFTTQVALKNMLSCNQLISQITVEPTNA